MLTSQMLFCRLIQAPFKARESFNNCVQQPYLIVYSTRHSRNVTHKTIALQHNINSISAHVGRLCHLYIWNWKDRHVLCLPAWPGAVAACLSQQASRSIPVRGGVSDHVVQCEWDRLTSGARGRRAWWKGKGYNCVPAANAMPNQNGLINCCS